MPSPSVTNEYLHLPLYTVGEASRLLSLQPSRVRRWLLGYQYDYGPPGRASRIRRPPVVVRERPRTEHTATFLDLMELLFIRAFIREGISLQKIRRALNEAAQIVGQDHPFARRRLFTLRRDIFMEQGEERGTVLRELLSGGQLGLREVILESGKSIDFDQETGFARRWWPLGKEKPVVINPRIAYGSPSVANRGVLTSTVHDLYLGEKKSVDRVAAWLRLDAEEVKAAVEFEESLRAA
jgi:uncharacterized protein (DUF433 family)/DNA-binding transcriptional MerR regulator